ncbi:N(alpha)-acetyltransferase 20, NatB catalytic subunit [Crenichthys baileyi]|uniref:N-alpha-acetyltransferase 20 n=1 Tax=Crenichthys baileyi TaxID=28760 RepID=A0AAV9SNA9_9TELE
MKEKSFETIPVASRTLSFTNQLLLESSRSNVELTELPQSNLLKNLPLNIRVKQTADQVLLFLSEDSSWRKMTSLRPFTCDDLFKFNNINLDPLTETYGIPFYLQYLAHWPEYFIVAEAPGGELMGYIMGKAEGSVAREEWHGHVTALSVAPEFRRLGLAAKLMEMLEEISERKGGFFVDLFVRVSNQVAVNMYKRLGYSVYRTVIEYYSASNGEPDEDAYDMRKALSRDTEKKSIIPLPHPVRPEDIE